MSSSIPTATGGAVPSMKQIPASTWSDLPDDLLNMVYSRLTTATPHDRLSFAAACRSWRAAAIALPRPASSTLPWLIYGSSDKTSRKRRLYIPRDNGEIMSMWLPAEAVDKRFTGFHDGGWVVAVDWQLAVINPFSGVEVPLSTKQRRGPMCGQHSCPCIIKKIIFSQSPTSGSCILAAITYSCGLALCGVGCLDSGWTTKRLGGATPIDIAFCNGELYGLMPHNELVKFEISVNENGAPMVTGDAHPLTARACGGMAYPSYIVELRGKIALLMRNGHSFKVYELVGETMTPYIYKWAEVESLGDYALFLGHAWSKAVYVPTGGRGVVQRNYIHADDGVYFMRPAPAYYGGSVYHMQPASNGRLQMVQGLAGRYEAGSPQSGMWLLPPNFY